MSAQRDRDAFPSGESPDKAEPMKGKMSLATK